MIIVIVIRISDDKKSKQNENEKKNMENIRMYQTTNIGYYFLIESKELFCLNSVLWSLFLPSFPFFFSGS